MVLGLSGHWKPVIDVQAERGVSVDCTPGPADRGWPRWLRHWPGAGCASSTTKLVSPVTIYLPFLSSSSFRRKVVSLISVSYCPAAVSPAPASCCVGVPALTGVLAPAQYCRDCCLLDWNQLTGVVYSDLPGRRRSQHYTVPVLTAAARPRRTSQSAAPEKQFRKLIFKNVGTRSTDR